MLKLISHRCLSCNLKTSFALLKGVHLESKKVQEMALFTALGFVYKPKVSKN